MIQDPFYNQIFKKLSETLDPYKFELCATDILRGEFPALVPVSGGNDAGMDGAIADGEGLPFPLIVTTSSDVIGNLAKNIKSYIKNGGTRRKAVVATTQSLTERRRNNLEVKASKLGFELVQIYDQSAFAIRLYYNSHWCKELLGLTGEPPAISKLPLTSRPLLGNSLIGRESAMTWLKKTTTDRLLVGQPGSGKTFLLYAFIKENPGYFIIKKDCSTLAEAIRTESPKFLIVDDAHIKPDFLLELRQLREQLSSSFEIIATCWPGAKGTVTEHLNLTNSSIYDIDLLNRDEIVNVIKSTGIHGPLEFLRELVNQAQGKPGLAVTLSHLCLQGDTQTVALGDALNRPIITFFEPIVGKKTRNVLAAIALGGNAGMTMSSVAQA